MTHKFTSIHWGISAYTIAATMVAGLAILLTIMTLFMAISAQREVSELSVKLTNQDYELRMVPRIASLCRSYWLFSNTTGEVLQSSEDLCDTLRDPEGDLPEAIVNYVQELDDPGAQQPR